MAASESWDAVVVGAGPAGSLTARELARRGVRVLLVDRATFPRPKVCGCCLNHAALAALDSMGLGHVVERCGAVPLNRVHLAAGRSTVELPLPGGRAISRDAFDAALLHEAELAGVTVRTGEAVNVVNHHADVGRTAITILATGLSGNTSRPTRDSRIGAGVIVPATSAPDFYKPNVIYMATGRGGYVGLVRLEDHRLDVAAAFDPRFLREAGGPAAAARRILEKTCWPTVKLLDELPWKGTPPLTRRPAAIAGPRWFAVGDAAGYVEPFTGEGMAWAAMSAAALAPIVARAAANWDDRFAAEWTLAHRRLIGRRQRICGWFARGLRSPVATRFAIGALKLAPALARPLVAQLNRPATIPHGGFA